MAQIETLDRMTVSSIETFFDSLLRGPNNLTENLFFDEMPTSLKKDWKQFVVIDCGNPLQDKDAYGRQTVLVYMYVKPNAYGKKDVKTMQELEQKLNRLINGNTDAHYHTSFRGRYSHYDAVNDMFFNIAQINLIIT